MNFIRILCTVLVLGFTFSVPVFADDRPAQDGVDLSQFALPDGSLPVICFGNGAPQTQSERHCPDCVTPSFTALVTDFDATGLLAGAGIEPVVRPTFPVSNNHLNTGHPPRAPPQV